MWFILFFKDLSSQDWYPYNIDQAKAIKLYNCAVLWTLKGDYPKAKSLLDQVDIENPVFCICFCPNF